MATKKIAAPSTTTATAAAKPARASKAVLKVDAKRPSKTAAKKATPPTVAATGKRGFAALAEGVPGLRSAAPAAPTLPQHVVKNLKGLREAMDKYPKATGYSTDRKFGIDTVNLHNTRGRIIAEIKLIAKK
jgi:hypothetical protein